MKKSIKLIKSKIEKLIDFLNIRVTIEYGDEENKTWYSQNRKEANSNPVEKGHLPEDYHFCKRQEVEPNQGNGSPNNNKF